MLLSQLPAEIIYCIASHFPTASCLWNLARTCRYLYHVISADNCRIFQAFVQNCFPTIDTPLLWKDAARALTSRSRAFDRSAIVCRYVMPPQDSMRIGQKTTVRTDRPTLGYRPVVDSYETWYGESWFSRREVLAWGAGADLIIRTTDFSQAAPALECKNGVDRELSPSVNWTVLSELEGVDSWDDISSVHLLGSSGSSKSSDFEDVILGRRNGSLARMSISLIEETYTTKSSYQIGPEKLEGTDISSGRCKVLAATLGSRSIAFFRVASEEEDVRPFATLKATSFARNRCSKLLSDEQIAVGADGEGNKISIFTFVPDNIVQIRDLVIDTIHLGSRKSRVTVIEPLSIPGRVSGKSGNLFLSGWEDSTVRLHDMRSPKPFVAVFPDTVDDCPTYCLRPIGQERFIAGSGDNALIKFFDMRVPGRYEYINSGFPAVKSYYHNRGELESPTSIPSRPRRGDISIYLSQSPYNPKRRYGSHRYRGPIYTISHPSPSSSTFYVGVEGGIIRLDMANTDDLFGRQGDWYIHNLDMAAEIKSHHQPISLTCYERPSLDDITKRIDLLYQLRSFQSFKGQVFSNGVIQQEGIPGWDERWAYLPGRRMRRSQEG
ncbi:hypothetical protein VTO42DRAFT_5986 [Malbranchea cinnamomea]